MHDKIIQLNKEIDELENKMSELETEEKEIIKVDKEQRDELQAEHVAYKKDKAFVIFTIKDEIDTCL